MKYDKIIVGAGLYGLYAALFCGRKQEKILVLEKDKQPFSRATYINQARVHMGYHYPRSLSTASKSAGYFERFVKDYPFCINGEFQQIYATSRDFSWTNAEQFQKFCQAAGIPCEEVSASSYFQKGACDGAFLTKEYTYDAKLLASYFLEEIEKLSNVTVKYGMDITNIREREEVYVVTVDGEAYTTEYLLNATYASANQLIHMIGGEKLGIKYELCEIILCNVSESLKDIGLTVMDGPFFSIMPFGKTGYHSLTSVTFTPHAACYTELPEFSCQNHSKGSCSRESLGNCNTCSGRPETAFPYMAKLARKYMLPKYTFSYAESLFSMKPILRSSEIDDSRPTVIRTDTAHPTFVSVLSGKINTVYDLDEVL